MHAESPSIFVGSCEAKDPASPLKPSLARTGVRAQTSPDDACAAWGDQGPKRPALWLLAQHKHNNLLAYQPLPHNRNQHPVPHPNTLDKVANSLRSVASPHPATRFQRPKSAHAQPCSALPLSRRLLLRALSPSLRSRRLLREHRFQLVLLLSSGKMMARRRRWLR